MKERTSFAHFFPEAAAEVERDRAIRDAITYHGGEWPEQLCSGVMFFNGERITKQQFEHAAMTNKDGGNG